MFGGAFCVLIVLLHVSLDVQAAGLVEVFGWKQMDYENRGDASRDSLTAGSIVFPGDDVLQGLKMPGAASASGDSASYIPYNNVPMGVNHYKGRLFITMPRRRLGIPSTLNYIDLKRAGTQRSPKLIAYPDLQTNTLTADWSPNDNQIISVYRTAIDTCGRLWFIDTGLMELPNNRTQVQRPSIWIFDLETNRRLHRFEIPSSVVGMGNGLASITIDVNGKNCDKAFAYIPDLANNAVYVYSLGQNRIWTFRHNYFHFDPTKGDLSIGGQNFAWDDGVFSITLGNRERDGSRTAYFHPMASTNEFTVSTSVLQTESNAARSYHGNDFKLLGSRGSLKQSTMHVFDPKSEIIFYAEIMTNGVGCWNTKKDKFSEDSHGVVAVDSKKMIYPSDLTIDNEGNIWVMTNSMPIFIYSQLNPNEVNFRVWRQSVNAAIENTVCAF